MALENLTLQQLIELKAQVEKAIETKKNEGLASDFNARAIAELEQGTEFTARNGVISIWKDTFCAGTVEYGEFKPGKGIGYFTGRRDSMSRKIEAVKVLALEFAKSGAESFMVTAEVTSQPTPDGTVIHPVTGQNITARTEDMDRNGNVRAKSSSANAQIHGYWD